MCARLDRHGKSIAMHEIHEIHEIRIPLLKLEIIGKCSVRHRTESVLLYNLVEANMQFGGNIEIRLQSLNTYLECV